MQTLRWIKWVEPDGDQRSCWLDIETMCARMAVMMKRGCLVVAVSDRDLDFAAAVELASGG